MKLHLPKSLIAALSAVYAAALPLATTVGAGTLLATAATYTAKAEEHSDVSGDTAYTNGDSYQLSGDAKFTGIPGGGTAATIDGTANHYNVTLQAAATDTQVVNFPILANVGDLTVERGRFLVNELGDFNGVNGGIYMRGGQLWFANAQYTGDNKITRSVTISTCSFTESSVASLERSALRISTNVEISGSLTVEGDGEGIDRTRIGFQGGSSLTLTGALRGSSDLGLGAYNNTGNSFSILGDSSQFTGALYFQNFNGNVNVTVKAGSEYNLHLGGIHSADGCTGSLGLVEGTTEATLTLDVAEGKSYSFDGSISEGYSIVKTGAGTQAFTNTANELSGSITVTAGTLVVNGCLGTGAADSSISVSGTGTLQINGAYKRGMITSVTEGGSIIFGNDASIYTVGLTLLDSSGDIGADGFLSERYRLAESGVNVSLAGGGTVRLMNEENGLCIGAATLSDGVLEVGGTYNIVTRKTHSQIHGEAESLGKTISGIIVRENGVLRMDVVADDNMVPIEGNGTLELAWEGCDNTANLGAAITDFTGHVIVKGGTGGILGSGSTSYSDHLAAITVESGGQITINHNRTGNITISGIFNAGSDSGRDGALKLGNGVTMTGNVAITGDTGSFSVDNGGNATISGAVQGDAGTGSSIYKMGGGSLTVNGGLSNISTLEVQGGTLLLRGGTLTDNGSGRIVYNGANTNSGYNGRLDGNRADGNYNALDGRDLVIKGNVSYDGEFVICSGTLALGNAIGAAPGNLSIKQITIQDGALMRIQGNGSDSHTTDIKLENGGTLYMHDSNAATNVNHFNQLIVAGAETKLEVAWKGIMRFESLTGEGTLTMKNHNPDTRTVEFKQIVNFNGTVTDDMVGTFKIGHVSQDNGFSASIGGTHVSSLSSDDFRKSGAGSLTMDKLTINENGTLYMTYDGTLQIGAAEGFAGLTVGNNATLKYDNASNLILLGSGNLSGVSTLTVNIDSLSSSALYSEGGYDLGIYSGYSGSISVAGMGAGDYTLTQNASDGNWHIAMTNTASQAWDLNWGAGTLKGAPATVTEAALTTDTYLSADGSAYLSDGVAAIVLTGSQGESFTGTPDVYGGNHFTGGTTAGTSWIRLESGTYGTLAGGSYAQWQSGSPVSAFSGDSHIMMEGGTVDFIIGGNYQDSGASTFTGDTYISVTGGTINGSIIGASTAAHNSSAGVFTGDTHIFIYTPLGGDGAELDSAQNLNYVIGARAHLTNTSPELNDANTRGIRTFGNTHISIETGDATGSFEKCVVGANFHASGIGQINNGSHILLAGSTNVSINSGEGVTYSNFIIAGSRADTAVNARDKVTDKITGSTNLVISGGTFNNKVIGGSYLARAGYVIIEGGTNVNLKGGTFADDVFGGSYFAAGTAEAGIKAETGAISVELAGATLAGDLHGGSYIGAYRGGDANNKIDHTAGVSVQVLSGSANNVYGGSVSASGTAYIEQGAVLVDLQGGTINGNVYAAGKQSSTNSSFHTASTTVKIGSGVEFGGTEEHIVSGGYTQYGNHTSVTGTATLDLASDGGYSNLTMVKLQDFDLIKYASDATVKSIAFITTSPGTVTVQGQGEAVLTVSAGLSKVSVLDIEGSLALTGSIAEHGGTFTKKGSGTLTLTGGSMQMSGGRFVVESGTVHVSGNNTGNVGAGVFNKADTTLEVLGGGTLKLDFNALGWSDSSTAGTLILQGDADKGRATLENSNAGHGSSDSEGNTMSYAINMKGHAEIIGDNTKLRLWHATIVAENLDNVISTGLIADQDTSITVEENGELEISGLLSGPQAITKQGAGKLTLSNTGNTYGGAITISDGTLEVTGSIANASSATVSGDGVLAVSGVEASVGVGGITATANSQEGGTAKNVIINASGITGATSTGDDALKVLGELSGLTLAFAAENTAAAVSNVTMRDVTIRDGAVSMNGVVAVASSVSGHEEAAPARMMARSLDAQTRADGTQTLTATTVKSGGSVSGDLTVDLGGSVLTPDNAGKTLVWTIFEGVSLAEGESFTLKLGDVLKTIVENGLPEVTLSGDWVNNEEQSIVLKSADLLNLSTASGGLLAAPVAGGNLVLTIDNIPEPTGSTLSLLALAALAARRRRRK